MAELEGSGLALGVSWVCFFRRKAMVVVWAYRNHMAPPKSLSGPNLGTSIYLQISDSPGRPLTRHSCAACGTKCTLHSLGEVHCGLIHHFAKCLGVESLRIRANPREYVCAVHRR